MNRFNKLKRIAIVMAMAFITILSHAQTTTQSTDVMRSNGKIYVVMAVVVTIIVGLFIYVVSIDKKITKLENKNT